MDESKHLLNKMKNIFAFILLFFISSFTLGAEIIQSKDQKILLSSDTEKFEVGQTVFIFDLKNSQTGSAKILTVKKNRAIALLNEGTALVGWRAQQTENLKDVTVSNFSWGTGVRTYSNSISVQQSAGTTKELVDMVGTNFSIHTFLGYKIYPSFLTQGFIGYEIYDVKGTATQNVCAGATSTNCFIKSNYLTLGGRLIYEFGPIWVGGGGTFKYSTGGQSNAIFLDDTKSKGSADLEIGSQIKLNNKNSVPISIGYEYSLNISPDVPKINQIYLNISYAYHF